MSKKIPLSNGSYSTVDDEDYSWLIKYKWHAYKLRPGDYEYREGVVDYYAVRFFEEVGTKYGVFMHDMIMGTDRVHVVDYEPESAPSVKRRNK